MVRIIEIPGDKIQVYSNKLELLANVGSGRVIGATLRVEDPTEMDPAKMPFEEWERNLQEIIKLSPNNPKRCDDSRESIYGPDPDEGTTP
jgi:hypothetical protein